jgi:dephospho-CoA kinase
VREEAEKLGLPMTREVQQNLGAERRKQFGGDYWVKKLVERIKNSGADFAVVNGVRTLDDTNVIKAAFGKNYHLVLLEASQAARFARMRSRNRPGDPVSIEELRKQEFAEQQKFSISDTMKLADIKIRNDSAVESFHKEIDKLLKTLIR